VANSVDGFVRPKHVAKGNSRLQAELPQSTPLRYVWNIYTVRCDAAYISRQLQTFRCSLPLSVPE